MSFRCVSFALVVLGAGLLSAADDAGKLGTTDKLPSGVDKKIASLVNPAGVSVAGPEGAKLDVWLLKELTIDPKFSPSLTVKYPFKMGQLIGLMRVPEEAKVTDFRGQQLAAGTYTLRYGQQPDDGNHIGTSDTFDFLLALPAKNDQDPAAIADFDGLSMKSAASAGSTHPAIFSLLPAEKPPEKTELVHDADHNFWILHLKAVGMKDKQKTDVPMRLVVIGQTEG